MNVSLSIRKTNEVRYLVISMLLLHVVMNTYTSV